MLKKFFFMFVFLFIIFKNYCIGKILFSENITMQHSTYVVKVIDTPSGLIELRYGDYWTYGTDALGGTPAMEVYFPVPDLEELSHIIISPDTDRYFFPKDKQSVEPFTRYRLIKSTEIKTNVDAYDIYIKIDDFLLTPSKQPQNDGTFLPVIKSVKAKLEISIDDIVLKNYKKYLSSAKNAFKRKKYQKTIEEANIAMRYIYSGAEVKSLLWEADYELKQIEAETISTEQNGYIEVDNGSAIREQYRELIEKMKIRFEEKIKEEEAMYLQHYETGCNYMLYKDSETLVRAIEEFKEALSYKDTPEAQQKLEETKKKLKKLYPKETKAIEKSEKEKKKQTEKTKRAMDKAIRELHEKEKKEKKKDDK